MTNKTFGVSIDELLRRSEGCEVPPIIKNIVEYLTKHGWCYHMMFQCLLNHHYLKQRASWFQSQFITCINKLMSVFSWACPVIDHGFRRNIFKVALDPRGDSRVDPQTTLTMLCKIHCQ